MRIVALSENVSTIPGIACEHGLSLYIEAEGLKILFDMGQSDLFIRNAKKLGIDLTQVDFAVISHGHYDHGGGLAHFLHINDTAPVYISPLAFRPHYNAADKYIGLDPSFFRHERLIFTDDFFPVVPNITLLSENQEIPLYPPAGGKLSVLDGGIIRPDNFRHEQYMLIETPHKRIVFSGCSHKGIQNIIHWLHPDVLIGGFHLSKFPVDDTLAEISRNLGAYQTTFYTCHCTGTLQCEYMQQYMERLHYLSCGTEIWV